MQSSDSETHAARRTRCVWLKRYPEKRWRGGFGQLHYRAFKTAPYLPEPPALQPQRAAARSAAGHGLYP
eukprot:14251013-Alexandrium_andersonii.AAC.1